MSVLMSSSIFLWVSLIFLYCWVVDAKTDSGDLEALKSLKRQWRNTPPNWVKNDPCGRKWEGISCNDSRVTAIILSGTNLIGSLPEDILSLSKLQNLDLSNNRGMMGPLPSNIGSLKNLVSLVLVNCNFSGPIPESIGSLHKLTHLFLDINHFTGPIPHSIGNLANLVWLDLSNNQLNGTLPVSSRTTSGLDMLLKVNHFHFGQNKLSGAIPPGLFSSNMALIHIVFNDNQLSGSIPDTLGHVLTLEVIRLDRNFLSGHVPQSLSALTNVSELYLANNNLSGPIPDLTGMNSLTYVDLSNNNFSGSVPPWFETLPDLTTLRMENTGLKGQIPEAVFSLPRLQTVVLRNNQLNDTVDIGTNFSSDLQLIDLQNNSIDEFDSGNYKKTILLDGNPFCTKPEAAGICKAVEPPNFLNFIPELSCAPLTCFSDQIVGSNCKRPYFGNLIFRSYNFSYLGNLLYYTFLTNALQPLIASLQVPIDKVCLVSSMVDNHGYLVLNVSFIPSDGAYFNRTGVSTIGNVLNDHMFISPYGPYYFTDMPYAGFPGRSKNIGLIIGITICGFVLVLLTISAGVYGYRQRKIAQIATKSSNPFASWDQGNLPQLKGARWFSFEEVKQCADNFSDRSEIGVGGYGKVYKGKLETGQLVAIKRAKQGSMQGAVEFKTEIELLSRVHHKNVVNLVGFCYDKGEQMLIYEYVPNGSLRASLSGKSGVWLNWKGRLKVALGAARGLAYLHELADPPIVHRDVKSDNILLNDHLSAKVADFGLSKPLSNDRDHVTTQVKGTVGYLDPEYYMTQLLTEKSDVYSFGVVMLELVTGKMPIEKNKYIVREVRETMNKTGNIYSLVDPAIRSNTLTGVKEFVDLAVRCLHDWGEKRPSMSELVKEVEIIIQESDMDVDFDSTSTSASYEGGKDRGHPYISSSTFSNSPLLG